MESRPQNPSDQPGMRPMMQRPMPQMLSVQQRPMRPPNNGFPPGSMQHMQNNMHKNMNSNMQRSMQNNSQINMHNNMQMPMMRPMMRPIMRPMMRPEEGSLDQRAYRTLPNPPRQPFAHPFSHPPTLNPYEDEDDRKNPNVPAQSYALLEDKGERTNLGNTRVIMSLLSEMWLINLIIIAGGTYTMVFHLPQGYVDDELWNFTCFWKLAWLLPLPYSLLCFFGLVLPFRTPKFLYDDDLPKRRLDNLYILTVTKGDNRDAVYRSWNAHRHLEKLHPCVRVHVLTDEPYFFENINCYTCPKTFTTANSKYKARALEWYRLTMRYTEHDWVLHLDEESVIDDESVNRVLQFIWFEHEYHWGQGIILYNQYHYWKNWFFTVADAIRVGDDLSRFQLQYSYVHKPIFGAHGSFLLSNGAVENAVTWDLGSLTEDFQFAIHAWELGYKCGKVPGIIREQSPLDIMGFLKQRRRWFVGIRRLPYALPKLWAFFWALGIFSLLGTLLSIPLGFVFKYGTPRWFGFLKDFSFCTFVYLYLVGIFIQDLDKKTNPLIILIHIPLTFVLQFITSVMEAAAVFYGIILPPDDFDVIKK